MRAKERIESADALEPARERDLDDRQIRLGEQLFGQEQALGLGQLDRRNAELLLDDAAQLPRADAQFVGQSFQVPGHCSRHRLRSGERPPARFAKPHPPEHAQEPAPAGTADTAEIPLAPPARSSRKTGTGRASVRAVQIGRQ